MPAPPPAPPADMDELLARAHGLAGRPLAEVAAGLGLATPADTRREKGWIGQLLETALGASAGSAALPDFPRLGVELKTLPVDARGRPRESTYVCTVPLQGAGFDWATSWVRRKLQCVLWFPVQSETGLALGERRLGMPLLWRPDAEEEALLRRDWEELMDLVCAGRLDEISARHGEVLQIRPKAADSRALTDTVSGEGTTVRTLPRGFYLRAGFTRRIIERHYVVMSDSNNFTRT